MDRKLNLRVRKSLPMVLCVLGGLTIASSWFFRGALGGVTAVYSTGFAVFLLFYWVLPSVLLGIAVLVSAQVGRGTPIIVVSIISFIYSVFIYSVLMSGDVRVYALPFALAMTGNIFSLLGGLLIRRKGAHA